MPLFLPRGRSNEAKQANVLAGKVRRVCITGNLATAHFAEHLVSSTYREHNWEPGQASYGSFSESKDRHVPNRYALQKTIRLGEEGFDIFFTCSVSVSKLMEWGNFVSKNARVQDLL